MAAKKKAKAKKAAPKKAAKVVKMKPKAKAAKKKTARPRSQILPGMEQVRNKTLDRVCEGISEVRADINRLRSEEQDLQRQAVKAMQAGSVTAYRFSGVELVLVPGDVKLRVRTMKETNADPVQEQAEEVADDSGVTEDEVGEPEEAQA